MFTKRKQGVGEGSMGKDSAGFTSVNNGRWESYQENKDKLLKNKSPGKENFDNTSPRKDMFNMKGAKGYEWKSSVIFCLIFFIFYAIAVCFRVSRCPG